MVRDVFADMHRALIKCGSPVGVGEVWTAFWAGRVFLAIGVKMSGSVWIRDGRAEIVHLAGVWDDQEAQWLAGLLRDWCRERAVTPRIWGRRGWPRFLRMKRFQMLEE